MGGSVGPDSKENKPFPHKADVADERYPIVIQRDGIWLYHGSPIQRPELVRLFSTVLHKDGAGEYWLITPAERGRITVEDAPFIGIALLAENGILKVQTNTGDIVPIDAGHPLVMREGVPYVTVRGGLEARLNQPTYYELVNHAVPEGGYLGIWSAGRFFPMGEQPA